MTDGNLYLGNKQVDKWVSVSMPIGDNKMVTIPEAVNHPKHYNQHPSGVECITIIEHYNFNLGSAMKYIWRARLKSENIIEDLNKAIWYLQREVKRIEDER